VTMESREFEPSNAAVTDRRYNRRERCAVGPAPHEANDSVGVETVAYLYPIGWVQARHHHPQIFLVPSGPEKPAISDPGAKQGQN
jgi:hypothetical protein